MIRRAAPEIRQLHFNSENDFLYVKRDKLTGQDTIQTKSNVQKTKDLKSMVINMFIINLNYFIARAKLLIS